MATTDVGAERRKILEMVAEGTISATEAANLLDRLEATRIEVDEGDDESPAAYLTPADAGGSELAERITAIKVIGTFQSLNIKGDPSIQGAVAEGPHIARAEDGTLVFEEKIIEEDPGFVMFARKGRTRRVRVSGRINGKDFQIGHVHPALRIRMNPSLPLEIQMTAGAAKVMNVHAPIEANVTAGSGKFVGVTHPISVTVEAGSVKIRGRFDDGASDIKCTAGKVQVQLEEGSDVRVKARATLGKIALPASKESDVDGLWQGIGGGLREAVIGSGKASLDIETTTGAVFVERI